MGWVAVGVDARQFGEEEAEDGGWLRRRRPLQRALQLAESRPGHAMALPSLRGGLREGTRTGVEERHEQPRKRLVYRVAGGRASSQISGARAGAGSDAGEAGGVNPGVASPGAVGAASPPKVGDASRSSSRGDAKGVCWLSVSDNVSASDAIAGASPG